jgi:hypothetical protein
MKKITLLLVFVFLGLYSYSQTTVTIGTGTLSAAAGTNASPVYRSSATSTFNFSQSVELLTATDLSAVGITSGSTITKIAYKKLNAFTMSAGRTATMKVYLKNSAATALGTTTNFATYTTGSTLCYNNAAYSNADMPAAAGWVEFVFGTPFNYSGGSIEVAIDWSINAGTGNPTDGGFTWEYTTVAGNQAAGTSNSVAITGNLTTAQTRIYNTQLTYTNTPCVGTPAPGNAIVSPATICYGSSATLSLQNSTIGSGVTYQWYLNSVLISGATNPNYVISNVTSSDTYYCEVTCAGNTTASGSIVVGPSILNAPILEPFATFLPTCWTNMFGGDITTGPTASTGSGWVADGFANVGTTGAIRNEIWTTGANDWVISPVINIPATGYELKFDAAATQFGSVAVPTNAWESDDYIEVLVAAGGSTTNWTVVYTYNDTNMPSNTGSSNIIDLTSFAGQNIRVAFHAVEGTTNGPADIDFSIDNFQIRLTPVCPDQTGLVVGNVTSTGADTSWDDMSGGGAIGYQYAITNSATPPASGTATTNTFYIAGGLLPQTVYYLHVRSECGAGFGNWSTTTFTTACAPITTLPWTENFDALAVGTNIFPACWAYTNALSTWSISTTPVAYSGANSLRRTWSTDGWAFTPTATLTAGTSYRFSYYVRTNDATVGYDITVGVGTSQTSAAMTTTLSSVTGYQGAAWVRVNHEFTPTVTSDYSFGIRVVAPVAPNGINFDDFRLELSPTCPDQTGLVVGNVTSSGADTSWDDMSATGAIGYEYAVTTSATPPASGTATTSTFYIATGLAPQTIYYLHVRVACTGSTFGNWATTTFTTACAPITTLPWNEGFESLTTVGTTNFPTCWFKENGDWSSQNTNGTYSTANTGTTYIRDSWSATNEYIWTPGFDLVAGTSYDFSSFVQGDNGTGWVVDYFVNTVQNSTGASQLGATYNVPGTGTPYAFQPYALVKRSFVPSTTGTYYFAVRVNQPSSGPWYVSFDDFKLELSPSCPTPSASSSGITDVAATINWSAVPSATLGYEYVLDIVATDPAASGTPTTSLTYAASGLTQLTTYYFHIRSVCAAGTYSTWSTISFTTLASPPINDNLCNATALTVGTPTGITNTLVGATAQTSEPSGSCFNGGINGSVWFSFVCPPSGSVEISTDFAGGTLGSGDTELAAYSGTGVTCSDLTTLAAELGCDQDGGTTVNFSSFLSLTGLTAGNTYFIQVDRWSTEAPGTFGILVSEVLSSGSFDKSNFIAYPNPVKDVLNLSYNSVINNVRVVNLLGQEVLNVKSNTNDVQVNMSALNAGAYIVNITVEDAVHTIKVIKE